MSATQQLINIGRQSFQECKQKIEQFRQEHPTIIKAAKIGVTILAAVCIAVSSPITFVAGVIVGFVFDKEVQGVAGKVKNLLTGRQNVDGFTFREKCFAVSTFAFGFVSGLSGFCGYTLGSYLGSKVDSHRNKVEGWIP